VSQGTAYLMTLSSYVEAVKQGVEIPVRDGDRDDHVPREAEGAGLAPGALVMLAGVVLLSLAG